MDSKLFPRLRALRARLKGLYLTAGLARLLSEVLGYLVLLYLLDRYVLLPVAVRWILLVLALGVLALRVQRLVLYPLRKPIRVEDMALAVEHHQRSLEGGLASAIELSRTTEVPRADVSPQLLDLWLRQLEERLARVSFRGLFDLRKLRRVFAVAGVLLVLVAGFSLMNRDDAAVFVQRLLGSSREWPRNTHLQLALDGESAHWRVETDEDGRPVRVHIARGASLPVLVRAEGKVPADVFLVVEEVGRGGREEEARMLPSDTEEGLFAYRFRNLNRPLRLHPRGGDDDGRRLELEVLVSASPTVKKVMASLTPPPYTGLEPVREERQEFTAPVGSRLDLEFSSSTELESGTITRDGDPSTAQELIIDPENPRRVMHSLTVEERGTLNLQLVGADGFRNLVPLDYPIMAIQDRKPGAEILRPRASSTEVTENGVVPLRALLRDDYGVAEARLQYSRFGDEVVAESVLLQSPPQVAMGQGAQGDPIAVFERLDLEAFRFAGEQGQELRLTSGQTLSYRLVVKDNREAWDRSPAPNELQTPLRGIEVVSEGEKRRKLSDRQLQLKQAISALRQSQQQKLEGLGEVAAALAETEDRELSRDLQALEVDQSRIATKAQQVSRDLSEIVEEYVLNRLDTSATRERVLEAWLAWLENADPRVRFDVPGLRGVLAAWKSGDFGQLDTLENQLGWLELALEASETHAQRALEKLREARITSRLDSRPALMDEALEAERKVVELYGLLLEKLVEWETFQEIVDQMRGLVEDQKALNEAYRASRSR